MDLHGKPFDEPTLAKLEIFEQYATAWLPVFVMRPKDNTVVIVDFFAGPGYDTNGVAGSPIRLLKVIRKFIPNIFQKNIKVKVYFNEYTKWKFKALQKACEEYLNLHPEVGRAIELELSNEDFVDAFPRIYPQIKAYPSLVFLDQNGIKFISQGYIGQLEQTVKTDFLYFISSSYFKRFGTSAEFQKHFKFDLEEAKKYPYRFIHNILLEQLKKMLPPRTNLKLYPFSIKKRGNIYGIVFGSKSVRGVEKFLNVAWKQNPINGNANFDIDEHALIPQLSFFEPQRLTKLASFQKKLEELIETKKLITNKEIYLFTLDQGHIPSHARKHLQHLKKQSKSIDYQGKSPKITFDSLTKNDYLVRVKWIKK